MAFLLFILFFLHHFVNPIILCIYVTLTREKEKIESAKGWRKEKLISWKIFTKIYMAWHGEGVMI